MTEHLSPYLRLITLAALCFFATACGSSDSEDGDSDSRSCTAVEVSEELSGGVILDDDCYIFSRALGIDDGELVITAGTTLYFEQDSGLVVQQSGQLRIEGSADEPVILRGDDEELGAWRGIYLESSGPHHITHARISDAGGRLWDFAHELTRGGLVLNGGASVDVDEVHFMNNEHSAITSASPDTVLTIDNAYFADNDLPMRLHAPLIDSLTGALSFENNRNDYVFVHTGEPLTTDATWVPLDVPYQFESPLPVHSHIIIEPETELIFERHAGLDFHGGTLFVDATGSDPVRFVGATDTAGYWRGLRFRSTPATGNQLTNVEVLHAGSERWDTSWSNSQANVLVHDGGNLTINHALIADGDYHGISTRDAVVTGCEGLTFRDNRRHDSHFHDGDEVCF